MKQTISEQALTLVEKKLSDLKGQLTPQDAATATGVTVDEAQGALSRLMELYVTRVSYDNNGNLLFAFEMPLRRRGTKTAAERWAEVKEALWRGLRAETCVRVVRSNTEARSVGAVAYGQREAGVEYKFF